MNSYTSKRVNPEHVNSVYDDLEKIGLVEINVRYDMSGDARIIVYSKTWRMIEQAKKVIGKYYE